MKNIPHRITDYEKTPSLNLDQQTTVSVINTFN